jgi:hypothetical protein
VGYDGATTDIDFRTDGLGDVGADDVTRSPDGDSLFFSYDPSIITPPQEALFLSILTDAARFAAVGTATIFAQLDPGGEVFAVTLEGIHVPVPEPDAVLLLAAGLVGVALIGRKRHT